MHELETPRKAISQHELETLLRDLASNRTHASIKLEIGGKSTSDHFSSVPVFEKHALLLTHLPTRTVVNVRNPHDISAFLIDEPYQMFLPFRRYRVKSEASENKVAE